MDFFIYLYAYLAFSKSKDSAYKDKRTENAKSKSLPSVSLPLFWRWLGLRRREKAKGLRRAGLQAHIPSLLRMTLGFKEGELGGHWPSSWLMEGPQLLRVQFFPAVHQKPRLKKTL